VLKPFFCSASFMCLARNNGVAFEERGDGHLPNSNMLDEVFDNFVNGVRLFKDREVLRHDYLPEKLPHREEQIKLLGATVAPVLKDARCSNIFIYGKTGTGKTAVTKYVLNRLEYKAREYGASVRFCYINCRMTGSEYRVFANLGQNVGITIPFTVCRSVKFLTGLDRASILLK
jgi:cell division control protein 6